MIYTNRITDNEQSTIHKCTGSKPTKQPTTESKESNKRHKNAEATTHEVKKTLQFDKEDDYPSDPGQYNNDDDDDDDDDNDIDEHQTADTDKGGTPALKSRKSAKKKRKADDKDSPVGNINIYDVT